MTAREFHLYAARHLQPLLENYDLVEVTESWCVTNRE